jgi:hypothetical protein
MDMEIIKIEMTDEEAEALTQKGSHRFLNTPNGPRAYIRVRRVSVSEPQDEIVTLTRSDLERRLCRESDECADFSGDDRQGFRETTQFLRDILLGEFDARGRTRWLGVEYRRAPADVD